MLETVQNTLDSDEKSFVYIMERAANSLVMRWQVQLQDSSILRQTGMCVHRNKIYFVGGSDGAASGGELLYLEFWNSPDSQVETTQALSIADIDGKVAVA